MKQLNDILQLHIFEEATWHAQPFGFDSSAMNFFLLTFSSSSTLWTTTGPTVSKTKIITFYRALLGSELILKSLSIGKRFNIWNMLRKAD